MTSLTTHISIQNTAPRKHMCSIYLVIFDFDFIRSHSVFNSYSARVIDNFIRFNCRIQGTMDICCCCEEVVPIGKRVTFLNGQTVIHRFHFNCLNNYIGENSPAYFECECKRQLKTSDALNCVMELLWRLKDEFKNNQDPSIQETIDSIMNSQFSKSGLLDNVFE